MKLLLYGKHADQIDSLVRSLGFEIVTQDPEMVLAYGGDGTLLAAEIAYPSVPKLPIRNSQICKKCSDHDEKVLLSRLKEGTLSSQSFPKLQVSAQDTTLTALNDIVIRNSLQMHAIRFTVQINDKPTDPILTIGDGLVAATPFGSSGYFESISRQIFTAGFAIGYNNPTVPHAPIPFQDNDVVTITIIRGPATISVDSSSKTLSLEDHATCTIIKAPDSTSIYAAKSLQCPNCVVDRTIRLG